MPDHKIRLRAAWDAEFHVLGNSATERLDLPANWTEHSRFPTLIRRGFNSPNCDKTQECLFLSLQNCWGVKALSLDGRLLWQTDELANNLEIELPSLAQGRHVLELELSVPDMRNTTVTDGPPPPLWGEISLIIRQGPATTSSPHEVA